MADEQKPAYQINYGPALPATSNPLTGDIFYLTTAATRGAYISKAAGVWSRLVDNDFRLYDVPFAAGNFTANGAMTWTVALGNQSSFYHFTWLFGNMMLLNFDIRGSVVGGVLDTDLMVAVPAGVQLTRTFLVPAIGSNAVFTSALHTMVALPDAGGLNIIIRIMDAAFNPVNWGAGATTVAAQMMCVAI